MDFAALRQNTQEGPIRASLVLCLQLSGSGPDRALLRK